MTIIANQVPIGISHFKPQKAAEKILGKTPNFHQMSRPTYIILTLLHSERPKLYAILAFLGTVGLQEFKD